MKKRRLRVRRHRASKGKALSREEREGAISGKAPTAQDTADLTEEEVELTEDDSVSLAIGQKTLADGQRF